MHPHANAVVIGPHFRDEPVGRGGPCCAIVFGPGRRPSVESRQAVLRDRDWVVLAADVSLVVEQRDTGVIEWSPVAGLPRKRHEVLGSAKRLLVHFGLLVPKGERPRSPVRIDAQHPGQIRQPS